MILKRLLFFMGILLGKLVLDVLFGLNRVKIVNEHFLIDSLDAGKSVIACCWHGRLIFPFYLLRNKGYYSVAGLHEDAEIISRVGEQIGWRMIRGSSTHGGRKAYRKMVDVLSSSKSVVGITPDGPKGPKQKVKLGAIRTAMQTGAFIIPMSGQASRRWEIKNWDIIVVPKPLGIVTFVFGEPMNVNRNSDPEESCRKLEVELNRVQDLADATAVDKS